MTRRAALSRTRIVVPTGACETTGSAEPRRQRLGATVSASTVAAPGGRLTTGPFTVIAIVAMFESELPSLFLKVKESLPWKFAFGV